MSLAQPFAADTQKRFALGLALAILALNLCGAVLIALAASGYFRDPQTLPNDGEKDAVVEQIKQLRGVSRPGSVMHIYADYLEQMAAHQGDSPAQLEAFHTQFLGALPSGFFLKVAGIFALFGLLILAALVLAVYGLYRFITGPPIRCRWQRWQKGVASPLPIWGLLAGCFLTVVALLTVRSMVPLNDSVFLQLGVWEAAQALLIVCLMAAGISQGSLRPWADFGFSRRPLANTGMALKYYLACLPIFWSLAIAGTLIFGVVDAAAGSPKDPDETRLTLEKIIQPANDPWGPAALFLAAVILAPLLEELFFRGFLYGGLRRWMSAPAAMVISGAVFAGMHPMQNHLPIFVLGMFLAYIYEKTGNLGASMAVHFTHNLIVTLLMGLAFL